MTHVKICGCMRVEDALAAQDAGAGFVGLMFAPSSRRRLTVEQAREIVEAVGGGTNAVPLLSIHDERDPIAWFQRGADALERLLVRRRPLTVGVFEDQELSEVNAIAEACGLDLIQLSGSESWTDCLLANRQVVKAVDVPKGATGDDVIAGLEGGSAIAFVLDSSRGRGIAIDREIAAAVAERVPVWLAGGLTPDNVQETVERVRPWAVDVSTGVETNGVKDAEKIHAFVQAAGRAGTAIGERSS